MMEMIAVKTVTAFAGSLGFGMIFNMKPRHLLTAAAGGMLDWILYYYLAAFLDGIFVPSVCAGMFSVLYGEILARVRRCPANLYVITTLIPLIPGGSLYYMMTNAVRNRWAVSRGYGSELVMYALGLAAGICLMSALFDLIHKILHLCVQKALTNKKAGAIITNEEQSKSDDGKE